MRRFITLSPQTRRLYPAIGQLVKNDWLRVRSFLEGTFPAPLPDMLVWDDIVENQEGALDKFMSAPFVVIDTEYNYSDKERCPWDRPKRLTLVGLYGPGTPVLQMPWDDMLYIDQLAAIAWIKRLVAVQKIWFQNTEADVLVLDKFCGIKWEDYVHTEDTMYAHAARWAEMPHRLEHLESQYGKHEKYKHLARVDPMLYNAGDVLSTASAAEGLMAEFQRDKSAARVYREFMLPLRPIIMRAQCRGIRINKAAVPQLRQRLDAQVAAAALLADAYVGTPLNLDSSPQVLGALRDAGIKMRTMKADKLVEQRQKWLPPNEEDGDDLSPDKLFERVEAGAHPLLEARAAYINARQYRSSYLLPLYREDGTLHDRVYPSFLPTAQANGRWSTTNPPLAQLPVALRSLIVPDIGHAWIAWDWDQIELRIFAAMARDEVLLDAFRNGWDVHTITAYQLFDLPAPSDLCDPHKSEADAEWRAAVRWEGKDDIRRVFCKRFVYRLLYGGDPKYAGSIPGAKKLGRPSKELVDGSMRWLRLHPGIEGLWRRFRGSARSQGEIRSFLGRVRQLAEPDMDRRVRQAYDQPMQAGCSDIFNKTVIDIDAMVGACFVLGMHDSQYHSCPLEDLEEKATRAFALAEREWMVDGVPMRFTMTPHLYFAPEDEIDEATFASVLDKANWVLPTGAAEVLNYG